MLEPQSPDTLTQADAEAAISTEGAQNDVYSDVWGQTEMPQAEPLGLERYMVEQDKLFVVVAVVLIIWFGLLLFLFRTDRRLAHLEQRLDAENPAEPLS